MEFRYHAADGEQLVLDTSPLHAPRVRQLGGKRFVREVHGAELKELQEKQRRALRETAVEPPAV